MFREKIKDFLAAQGMIKGHSGSGTRTSEQEGVLVLIADHGRDDTSSPHSPSSVDSSDDHRRPNGHNISSTRLVDDGQDRKSTRLNSSHTVISYAVFCLKKKHVPTSSRTVSTLSTNRAARELSTRC